MAMLKVTVASMALVTAIAGADSWCVDKDARSCRDWGLRECKKNPGFMRGHCPRTCGRCDMISAKGVEVGSERVNISTPFGPIVVAFFPKVAPITSRHILRLFELGCYETALLRTSNQHLDDTPAPALVRNSTHFGVHMCPPAVLIVAEPLFPRGQGLCRTDSECHRRSKSPQRNVSCRGGGKDRST